MESVDLTSYALYRKKRLVLKYEAKFIKTLV